MQQRLTKGGIVAAIFTVLDLCNNAFAKGGIGLGIFRRPSYATKPVKPEDDNCLPKD